MKIISPSAHGYLDYVTVVVLLAAPMLLGLSGLAAIVAYLLGAVHLAMTLVTNFPRSLAKWLPFSIHGWVERLVAPSLVIASFIPAFATDSVTQIFYLVMGVVSILVGLLTSFQEETPSVPI